jgi:beta-lactamase class D
MRQYVALADYGNADTSGGDETFWLTGGLRISPREQLAFLVRLYRGELPFAPATQAAVRELMLVEQGPDNLVRGKTGWATLPGDEAVGWWVGWVEQGETVHFFATLLEGRSVGPEFGPARMKTTRQALTALGVP